MGPNSQQVDAVAGFHLCFCKQESNTNLRSTIQPGHNSVDIPVPEMGGLPGWLLFLARSLSVEINTRGLSVQGFCHVTVYIVEMIKIRMIATPLSGLVLCCIEVLRSSARISLVKALDIPKQLCGNLKKQPSNAPLP